MRILLSLFLLYSPLCLALEPGDSFPFSVAVQNEKGARVAIPRPATPYMLVDIWASWCGPCAKAFPLLEELSSTERTRLSVVGVNVDTDRAAAAQFLGAHAHSFPNVFDPAGAVPEACDASSMPTTILVNKAGRVVRVFRGFRESDAAEVRNLLNAEGAKSI